MNIEVGDKVIYKNKDDKEKITTIVTSSCERDYLRKADIEILKIERPEWRVVEEKKDLLTEEEREFLKSYLKFMRLEGEDMRFTKKLNILYCLFDDDSGYKIEVDYCNFREIKSNQLYTLKELRIGGLNGRI